MALNQLHRISCNLLSKSCSCSPLSSSMFCSTVATGVKRTNNIKIKPSMKLLTTHSTYIQPTVSKVRLFSTKTGNDNNEDNSLKGKAAALWKNYGRLAIGTYFGIYITTLGSIFLALDFDILNVATFGLDPVYAVQKVCDIFESVTGNDALPGFIRQHPKVGTFAIAWAMTKFTEPLRFGLTLATVPSISRWWNGIRGNGNATVK